MKGIESAEGFEGRFESVHIMQPTQVTDMRTRMTCHTGTATVASTMVSIDESSTFEPNSWVLVNCAFYLTSFLQQLRRGNRGLFE